MEQIVRKHMTVEVQTLDEASSSRITTLSIDNKVVQSWANRPRTLAIAFRDIADFLDSQPDRPGDERPIDPRIMDVRLFLQSFLPVDVEAHMDVSIDFIAKKIVAICKQPTAM